MNGRLGLASLAAALVASALPLTAQPAPSTDTGAPPGTERYIVKFNDHARGRAAIERAGGRVVLDLRRHAAAAAHLTPQAVGALQANPNVAYVELDPQRHPMAQAVPYGVTMVQATDPAFSAAPVAQKTVCVIDSGINPAHEDFAGIAITGFDNPDLQWNQDGCGHGTHVAGTIAAANNLFGVLGVAPTQVSLHVVRVFGDSCDWTYASNLVAAVDACADAGASVLNMSLGGPNPSRTEAAAFDQALASGILPVAAAGNAGNTTKSYPAAYESVVSVGAIDKDKALAGFSQRNADVELVAPGVAVLSTTPWDSNVNLQVGGQTFAGMHMEGGLEDSAAGALVNGGQCTQASNWTGMVVLCERGSNTFRDKIRLVTRGGGIAAVVYNNVEGNFSGTLGNAPVRIPAISLSQADGQAALAYLGQSATVNDEIIMPGSSYEEWEGTSMATPHVAGVAALIWSYFPGKTAAQIRGALTSTAEDLGTAGRDNSFGHGLIRAKNALDALAGP